MNKKLILLGAGILTASSILSANAGNALSQYCPNAANLRYVVVKPTMGKVYSVGSNTANYINFENPYMRNKEHDGGLVPLPAYLDGNNDIEGASVNHEWETYYGEGTLICYYLYQSKAGDVEKLNMMSERGTFHQCEDGRVLPNNTPC